MPRVNILIALILFVGLSCAANDIIVKNNRLYVNCEEFFVKSFCYSPTPLARSDPNVQVSVVFMSENLIFFSSLADFALLEKMYLELKKALALMKTSLMALMAILTVLLLDLKVVGSNPCGNVIFL